MLAFVTASSNSFRPAILGTGCGFVNEAELLCVNEFELTAVLVERGMAATRAVACDGMSVRVLDIWSYYVLGTESDADHTRRGFIFHLNRASKVPRQTSRLANSTAVRAARPATRPAHSFFQFRAYPLNMLFSRFRLHGDDPTDPLIAREWRNVFPLCPRRRVRNEGFSQIRGYSVYRALESTFLAINFILHRG
jgi:hypothetical protein